MTTDNDRLWELLAEGRRESQASHESIRNDIAALRQDVAVLKLKAGVWGLVAGLIPAVGMLLVVLVTKIWR